jgi:hypothetical protein
MKSSVYHLERHAADREIMANNFVMNITANVQSGKRLQ